jgi:hypothetical protein
MCYNVSTKNIDKRRRLMKITTFNPQIITTNEGPVIDLFEELGFEKHHVKEGIGDLDVNGIRMKSADGFYIDVSVPDAKLDNDMACIRMNVDDFDEAYNILKKYGFKNVYGRNTVETESAKSAVLVYSSGFIINLIQHKK